MLRFGKDEGPSLGLRGVAGAGDIGRVKARNSG